MGIKVSKVAGKSAARQSKRHSRVLGWSDACKLGEALPGVERSTSFGLPALKVKGKFLILHRDAEHFSIHIDKDAREIVMAANPEAFYITDHYKNYPAMLIRIAKVTRAELRELLEQAWRAQAPMSLRNETAKGKPGRR